MSDNDQTQNPEGEGEDEDLNKIFDAVHDLLPEGATATPKSVEPLVRKCVHVAAHLAVVARISPPEFVKLCLDEYIDAQRCVAAQLAEDMLSRILEARGENMPEEEQN